jgi:hypothetical protein
VNATRGVDDVPARNKRAILEAAAGEADDAIPIVLDAPAVWAHGVAVRIGEVDVRRELGKTGVCHAPKMPRRYIPVNNFVLFFCGPRLSLSSR